LVHVVRRSTLELHRAREGDTVVGYAMGIDDTRTFSIDEKSSAKGELVPGALAGGYVISRFLARGGCGSVYEAHHPTVSRRVAVKVLHLSLSALPKMVGRFSREVQIVNLLRHPNIVEIFEVGSLPDGRPFYVMEYLEGKTLHELLQNRGRMPPEEVLSLIEPVCAALEAAHAAGVVHRDVKASNICVVDGEPRTVKLLDFGIAKLTGPNDSIVGLTSAGRQVGTMTIMAPEQFTGGVVDLRVDIYALGILLYRLLTGRFPFDARSPLDLARQHMEEPAPRPSQRTPLPPALDAVVLRCLEKLPERRFESVTALLEALRAAVVRVGGSPAPPPRDTTAMGLGIHVEITLGTDNDELDDGLSDDLGFVLDRVEETLKDHGFTLATVTGTVIFGVRPLPAQANLARAARAEAMVLAKTLSEELESRPDADPRVQVHICLHVADIVLRAGKEAEIAGGALLRTERWAPREPTTSVMATPEFRGEESALETLVEPETQHPVLHANASKPSAESRG
jgi:serine/threonine protein kinase